MTWCSMVVAAALALAASANVGAEVPKHLLTPVASVDSGLGDLPHYSEWREPWVYATPAEKIDSGLGELRPFSEWREPWAHATPAEKIDSGLGELPPFSEWRESWALRAGSISDRGRD